ncbi:MAG: hypothetical protein LBH78_00840 [Rickettsiales bacterium]|jgi:hypothetical protein|nr:hypothetical protein [Rickettsiales bacterium]
MHNSDTGTEKEYKIEDLPRFFKRRSKDISEALSNESVEIITIRSRSTKNDVQEFSFKLKLLTTTGKDTSNMRPLQIKPLIDFFKTCFFQEKNFTVNIEVSKESEELCNSLDLI